MRTNTVLVLGSEKWEGLVKALYRIGFDPLVRETLASALHEIPSARFAAVIIDKDRAEVDPLEFILNVRDLDSRTPIVVVGGAGEAHYERALIKQSNVIRLDAVPVDNPEQALKRELEEILAD